MASELQDCLKRQLNKSLQTTVILFDQQKDLCIPCELVKQVVLLCLDYKQVFTKEIHLYFIDELAMCALHKEFFDDSSPTDCMTFPMDSSGPYSDLLGEIIICPKMALQYDSNHPVEELLLYVVHGILHLLGYEDTTEDKAQLMRNEEDRCLDFLKTQLSPIVSLC